jgi:hypothetical protein
MIDKRKTAYDMLVLIIKNKEDRIKSYSQVFATPGVSLGERELTQKLVDVEKTEIDQLNLLKRIL